MTREPATTATETRYALIEKLRHYVDLDGEEVGALTRMLTRTRRVPRGRDIVVQGQPYRTLYVLIDGLALRYKVLSDGRRQVLNLSVPGDLIGLPACLFEGAIASVSGLTDTTVSPIEFEELFSLFRHYPRISTALFWTSAREAGIYIERLATIGRRSAYERMAHLILEMLADTLGLSLQHVNRMIRNLREEGLASIEEHKITIHDMESLVRLAGFEDTYLSRHKIPGLS